MLYRANQRVHVTAAHVLDHLQSVWDELRRGELACNAQGLLHCQRTHMRVLHEGHRNDQVGGTEVCERKHGCKVASGSAAVLTAT